VASTHHQCLPSRVLNATRTFSRPSRRISQMSPFQLTFRLQVHSLVPSEVSGTERVPRDNCYKVSVFGGRQGMSAGKLRRETSVRPRRPPTRVPPRCRTRRRGGCTPEAGRTPTPPAPRAHTRPLFSPTFQPVLVGEPFRAHFVTSHDSLILAHATETNQRISPKVLKCSG